MRRSALVAPVIENGVDGGSAAVFYAKAGVAEDPVFAELYRLFFASTFSLFLQTPSAAATQGNLRVIFH